MKGAAAKMDKAIPRSDGGNRSAMTPPELVMGEAPKVPAKKRNTKRDAIELAPAEAATKATTTACVVINKIRRP